MTEDPKEFLARQNLPATAPSTLSFAPRPASSRVRLSGELCAKNETSICIQISDSVFEIPYPCDSSIEESEPTSHEEPERGPTVTLEIPEMTKVVIRQTITVMPGVIKPFMLALGSSADAYSVPAEAVEAREQRRRAILGVGVKGDCGTDHTSSVTTTSDTYSGKTSVDTTVHDSQGNEHVKTDEINDYINDTSQETAVDQITYDC